MEYQLTAELTAPAGAPDLDPLQQVGAAALLDTRLNRLASIEGPDGVEITPVEHSVDGHVGGASVSWLLDAPALVFAEDATRSVLEQIIEDTELLTGWQVKHCAVTATDDQLASALAAGAGPVDEFDLGIEAAELPVEELEQRREALDVAAAHLRAFDVGELDDVTPEEARYVAGALMHGVELLTDELFGDIQLLEDEDVTADEVEALWVLDELPARFSESYTALFAKQFLVSAAILGYRLTQTDWTGPLSVAEALALHIAKVRADTELELAGVLDEQRRTDIFALLDKVLFNDDVHESLYDLEGPVALPVDEWFRPCADQSGTRALHPYLADEDPADLC